MSGGQQGESSLVTLGIIRKPLGLDGCCAVEVFGETLKNISLPVEVLVGSGEKNCRKLNLKRVEFRAKGPACFFDSISDLQEAETLRGFFIYIHTEQLPELGENKYYHFQLTGVRIRSDIGMELGECINVYNFPSIDSLEVRRSSGDTIMIPLSSDAVMDIDWKSGYLTVRHQFIEELL